MEAKVGVPFTEEAEESRREAARKKRVVVEAVVAVNECMVACMLCVV